MEDCSEEVIKKLQEDSLSDDYHSGFFKFTDKYSQLVKKSYLK